MRFSSSVAVVADDGRVLLLDCGPDLKHHERVLRSVRSDVGTPPIDGVCLTHGHVGHYAGLLHLGREAAAVDAIPCWVTPSMASFLTADRPWRLLVEQGHLALQTIEPGASGTPWDDLTITFIPVPHRREVTDTVAISVNGVALYLPDIDSWEDWPEAERVVSDHRIALLDATFWSPDELPHRDISAIGHPMVTDTLERFGHLAGDRRLLLTHLNHTNPLCASDAPERDVVRAAGFETALEGMVIPL
jgi:pyrroloquinoline quinone biosynthesis protein B